MINREGYYKTDLERECTKCGTIFPKPKKTVTLCPSCNSERVKSERQEVRMFRRAKSRAKERNIEFSIDKSDVIIPEFCPILGIKLEPFAGHSGGRPNSPALDRIDNSKGYIKGNVVVISHLANMMKSSASREELLTFADWVQKAYSTAKE
jgi:uncharacterized Zn finger protein (UPF0148 family)